MADSYEAEQMPGVGAVLMRHKVTSPRWLMGLMSGLPLVMGGVVAAGLAIGGSSWSALGAFAGGLAFAALFTAINVTFASARIAVSEGELHVQLGLAGPRIPIGSIRGVHVGPSGRNKIGMGVTKDLRGKTWYTLWGDNAHAVHVEHVRVRGAVGPVANRGDVYGSHSAGSLSAHLVTGRLLRRSSLA